MPATPTRIALVGCGSAKQDEAAKAADLYTSSYFSKKREFAETLDAWYIVSAEHALVRADDVLEPYDRTVTDYPVDGRTIEDWADEVVEGVARILDEGYGLPDGVAGEDVDDIVLLAGRDYVNPIYADLKEVAFEHGVIVSDPFSNLGGLFEQMSWLSTKVEVAEKNGGHPLRTRTDEMCSGP